MERLPKAKYFTVKEVLHPALLGAIQKALSTEKAETLLPVLFDVFQSIPETHVSASVKGIIDMRSKKKLLPELLLLASKPVREKVISQLTDLSYDPALSSLRPAIGDSAYVKSGITLQEYRQLAAKGRIDISEFLVLTIGLFDKCKLKLPVFLISELLNDYLFTRYDDCLTKILAFCKARIEYANNPKYKDNPLFLLTSEEDGIFREVLLLSEKLTAFDPQKNRTRKFFETRLSQYITGIMHHEKTIEKPLERKQEFRIEVKDEKPSPVKDERLRDDTLRAVNKILTYYLGPSGKVHNPKSLEVNISIFGNAYKDRSRFDPKRLEAIQKQSKAYARKDRIARGQGIKERKYEVKTEDVGESVWNSSGGAMSGITPTFLDSQLFPPVRNALIDTTRREERNPERKEGQWGHERRYSAYVGSISGHAGNMIGILESYMRDNKSDPSLSEDINLFLAQVVGVYVKRGFHGILEVMDMLHDESNQAIFKEYGVSVNLENLFSDERGYAQNLVYAMNDAVAYTKTLVFKQMVAQELKGSSRELKRQHSSRG